MVPSQTGFLLAPRLEGAGGRVFVAVGFVCLIFLGVLEGGMKCW